MKLSVIVVSFNVRGYVALCLDAALQAMSRLEAGESELILFDNASSDGTVDWVRGAYPEVQVMASAENLGFSAGNNAAIQASKGEWVLLLNPDTVVPESTFEQLLEHVGRNDRVGAVGVPMVDGAGRWLPESKRGVPTPWASFCRLSGLWRLAPTSKTWNGYYFGHVMPDETAEVEVLSGAFMALRRAALDEVGLLDEDFFMYGEDIDLSIRVSKGGWVNHYLSSVPIVHFKGESTKKGSLSYVRVFHDAMRIFSAKHFAGGQALAMRMMIELGIRLRSVSAFLNGWVARQSMPLLDTLCAMVIAWLWALVHEGWSGIGHPPVPSGVLVLCAGLAALMAGQWFGTQDRPFVQVRAWLAGAGGGVGMVSLYSVLPEEWRISRLVLGVSALSMLVLPWGLRSVLVWSRPARFRWRPARNRVAVLADGPRLESLVNWVKSSYGSVLEVNRLSPGSAVDYACLKEEEMVLVDAGLGGQAVLEALTASTGLGLDVRVVPEKLALALGGSRRHGGLAAWLPWGADGLGREERRRAKRRVDVLFSLYVMALGSGRGVHKGGFQRGVAWEVLRGRKTWLGWHGGWEGEDRLPSMPEGVFRVGSGRPAKGEEEAKRLDLRYAYDFGWIRDVELLMTLRME